MFHSIIFYSSTVNSKAMIFAIINDKYRRMWIIFNHWLYVKEYTYWWIISNNVPELGVLITFKALNGWFCLELLFIEVDNLLPYIQLRRNKNYQLTKLLQTINYDEAL